MHFLSHLYLLTTFFFRRTLKEFTACKLFQNQRTNYRKRPGVKPQNPSLANYNWRFFYTLNTKYPEALDLEMWESRLLAHLGQSNFWGNIYPNCQQSLDDSLSFSTNNINMHALLIYIGIHFQPWYAKYIL